MLARIGATSALILLSVISPVQAGNKTVTVRGTIFAASFDSAINLEHEKPISFVNDSDEGNKIFAVCGHGDTCEITGVIDDKAEYVFFLSVSHVKKISKTK